MLFLLLLFVSAVQADPVVFWQDTYEFNMSYCDTKVIGASLTLDVTCPDVIDCTAPSLKQDKLRITLMSDDGELFASEGSTQHIFDTIYKPYFEGTISCINGLVVFNSTQPQLSCDVYDAVPAVIDDCSVSDMVVVESTTTAATCIIQQATPRPSLVTHDTSASNTLSVNSLWIFIFIIFY
jgi:hypothetical protein